MAQSNEGLRGRRRAKATALAARMKALRIERTTGRCAQCYRIIAVDSSQSRYKHICKG